MNKDAESRESSVQGPNSATGLGIPEPSPSSSLDPRQHLSPTQRAWQRLKRNKPAVACGLFLILLAATLLLWPWVSSADPNSLSDAQFRPPDKSHWFGTDVHGRDLVARVLYGARVSLLVGVVGAGVSLIIGVLWGAVAGYVGGQTDSVMMRFVDILYALPSIVFVIVLITTLNGVLAKLQTQGLSAGEVRTAQFVCLFAGLGAVSWLTMARIVRGQVLSLRARQFVDASRGLGASHSRILLRHILPNVFGVIIVYLTLTVPAIILYESFLSFLGLGIRPPQASLGSLIAEGAMQINPIRIYWWLIVFPGGILITTLLALNFLGDGLRDAFDPRADKSRG